MLLKIRKASNSKIFKLVISLIAVTFVLWGASNLITGKSGSSLVKFSDGSSISVFDFLKFRERKIRTIQLNDNKIDKDIFKQSQFNYFILEELIMVKMLNSLAKDYSFALSDEASIEFLSKIPTFKNKEGKFEERIFRKYLELLNISEQDMIKDLKEEITRNKTISLFGMNGYLPKDFIKTTIDHLSEEISFDVISLTTNNNKLKFKNPSEKELVDFYERNKNDFKTSEKRDIKYIVFNEKYFNSNVSVENNDIEEYLKNEIDLKDEINKVNKSDIEEKIYRNKVIDYKYKLTKQLEDDVASGSNITEIAEKYKIDYKTIKNTDINSLQVKGEMGLIFKNAFDLSDKETSYPIEYGENDMNIVLFEISNIYPSLIPEISKIKDKLVNKYKEEKLVQYNKDMIEKTLRDSSSNIILSLKDQGAEIKNYKIIRGENFEKKFPQKIIESIIRNSKKGFKTKIFEDGNKLYFGMVRGVSIDQNKVKELTKSESLVIQKLNSFFINDLVRKIKKDKVVNTNWNLLEKVIKG